MLLKFNVVWSKLGPVTWVGLAGRAMMYSGDDFLLACGHV